MKLGTCDILKTLHDLETYLLSFSMLSSDGKGLIYLGQSCRS
jgi:hypothetical protein